MFITSRILRFSTTQAKEFPKYFKIDLDYHPNAYYLSYDLMKEFRTELKDFSQKSNGLIIGGHNFPMQSGQFWVNCNSEDQAKSLVNNSTLMKNNIIKNFKVRQLIKQSEQKFEKLTQFYDSKTQ